MGFRQSNRGWDSPRLYTPTLVGKGLPGSVWWGDEGQDLWFYRAEAGGGSENLISRSHSILQQSKNIGKDETRITGGVCCGWPGSILH